MVFGGSKIEVHILILPGFIPSKKHFGYSCDWICFSVPHPFGLLVYFSCAYCECFTSGCHKKCTLEYKRVNEYPGLAYCNKDIEFFSFKICVMPGGDPNSVFC